MQNSERGAEAAPSPKQEIPDRPYIIAMGGGKGGIGKTVLSASFGMGLAMLHKNVIVVDSDFGAPNLHKVFGNLKSKHTMQDFFRGEVKSLNDLQVTHPQFENFSIIESNNSALNSANLPYSQKLKFLRHIRNLQADYIILDLGAGTNYHILDFFLSADIGVVTVTPDPLSILDCYQFIKRAFLRNLIHTFNKKDDVWELVNRFVSGHVERHHANIEILINELDRINPGAVKKLETMQKNFNPKLLINRLQNANDEKACLAVQTAAKALLSVEVDYWGSIQHDKIVQQAVLDGKPFILHDSKARASRDLATIVITKLLKPRGVKRMHAMHTMHKSKAEKTDHPLICSYQCPYWEECELRNGGYPCELGGL